MAKDPVCGMIVNEKTGIHSEIGGRKFYFCSPVWEFDKINSENVGIQ